MLWTPIASKRIYTFLYNLCPPYRLPHPWHGRTVDADSRAVPQDPIGLLAQLTASFDATDLCRGGVAQVGADGDLMLAPALLDSGPLVLLRPHPDKAPLEILTGGGCLSGGQLPIIASLSDYRTLKALPKWDHVM